MSNRGFGRTRAIASLAIALMRIPSWLASAAHDRRGHERAFFSRIVRGFGLTIDQHGAPSAQLATLFIMNHISWADIPVMMAILDADFVAKADMLGWPIIGWLARRFSPVFVSRNEPHHSHNQAEAIRSRLREGRSVILCAEGTTSDGTSILPFRTSLFAAADAAAVVQPIVLRYLAHDGSFLSPERQRAVAWIDDDDLLSGAMRLATDRTLARVEFLKPVEVGRDRKLFAEAVRRGMLEAYAAAPNRPR